jgi:N-acetylneuraminate synthase
MIYLSTPFSIEAADKLYDMGVKWFKVGSGECSNFPFIEYLTKFGLPIILSTGMNKFEDIKKSVKIIEKKKIKYSLMQCTSMYPTPQNSINLNVISTYKKNFRNAVIGFSDHSLGNYAAISSVALGARIIEKHFTSSKSWKGEDIPVSMCPKDLKELINGSISVFKSLGHQEKKVLRGEKITQKFAFSSVVSTQNIKAGELFTKKNIWVKRPGIGQISANFFFKLIGKKSLKDIKKNSFITYKMFKKNL